MVDTDTLIDQFYATSFGKPVPEWASNKLMRRELAKARRFILDDGMASFLGDITAAACNRRTVQLNDRAEHQMRRMARLPHPVTWVEFDLLEYMRRERELLGFNHLTEREAADAGPASGRFVRFGPDEKSTAGWRAHEGWLLHQLGKDARQFAVHVFHRVVAPDGEGKLKTPAVAIFWRTDDGKSGAGSAVVDAERGAFFFDVVLGGEGRQKIFPQVNMGPTDLLSRHHNADGGCRTEMGLSIGVMRRLWAFLATVNNIPVLTQKTRQARGFSTRAQRHCFLEHKVLTLNVPQRTDRRQLARNIVAISKRRAHTVRGHWRKDWKNPLSPLCEHDFETPPTHFTAGCVKSSGCSFANTNAVTLRWGL